MAGKRARGLITAALVTGMLAGCSPSSDGGKAAEDTTATGGQPGGTEQAAKAADKGGTVGEPSSPCDLPVSFDLAASWKAEAVSSEPELGGTVQQGTVELVCEIDAKPAGHIGFLRVWTGDRTDSVPRKVLETFMAAEKRAEQTEYQETQAGEFAAAEVGYLVSSDYQDEPKKERALAVTTPDAVVVVHLGGLDTAEHEAMLPAYELAKQSMRRA